MYDVLNGTILERKHDRPHDSVTVPDCDTLYTDRSKILGSDLEAFSFISNFQYPGGFETMQPYCWSILYPMPAEREETPLIVLPSLPHEDIIPSTIIPHVSFGPDRETSAATDVSWGYLQNRLGLICRHSEHVCYRCPFDSLSLIPQDIKRNQLTRCARCGRVHRRRSTFHFARTYHFNWATRAINSYDRCSCEPTRLPRS